MRVFKQVICICALVCSASNVMAHTIDNLSYVGQTNSMQSGMAFLASKTEYTLENGEKFALNEKCSASIFSNLGDDISVFAQAAMIMRTELVDATDYKGDGYLMGMGVKTEAYRSAKVSTVPFLQFNYQLEELRIKEDDIEAKTEIDIYEVSLGALLALTPERRFSPFVGVEIFLLMMVKQNPKLKKTQAMWRLLMANKPTQRRP